MNFILGPVLFVPTGPSGNGMLVVVLMVVLMPLLVLASGRAGDVPAEEGVALMHSLLAWLQWRGCSGVVAVVWLQWCGCSGVVAVVVARTSGATWLDGNVVWWLG